MNQHPPPKTEAEFLEQQSLRARSAVRRAMRELRTGAQQAELSRLAGEHPWLTVTAAAVAGVVAGRVLSGPAKRRDNGAPAVSPAARPGILSAISAAIGEAVLDIVKPLVRGALAGWLTSRPDPAPPASTTESEDRPR
jgi:hypothetical protein